MNTKKRIYITWRDAKSLIEEADIFLFRGSAWYSWIIKKFTQSEYSHVALASWHNGVDGTEKLLELIEFHGFRGGGVVIDPDTYFPGESGLVDIYRPSDHYDFCWYNQDTRKVEQVTIKLFPKAVTHTMRRLTGLPYGWRRMWWFAKRYMAGIRLFYDLEDLTSDDTKDIVYPVCSTAIAYSFNHNCFDLMHNKGDEWTKPSDVSESTLLHYLFTIV
jgi:hypothetical protein